MQARKASTPWTPDWYNQRMLVRIKIKLRKNWIFFQKSFKNEYYKPFKKKTNWILQEPTLEPTAYRKIVKPT